MTAVCVLALAAVLTMALLAVFSIPAKAELAVPADYGTGYEIENLTGLAPGGTFEGIQKKDANRFLLTFDEQYNGLVTLARISQNDSLAGFTFEISHGKLIELDVKYDNGTPQKPISAGSFFGIGCDAYPFKGQLLISGAADTPVAIGKDSWRCLFNNLSNEASIVSAGSYRLYSSPSNQNNSQDTFPLCSTLTVTAENGELDISGFRFGAASGTGSSGALVTGSNQTALLAGTVKKTVAASAFSVDLSASLTDGMYTVQSSGNDAAGVFGLVTEGVQATVGLPDVFKCEATAEGYQKNAGMLVGSNYGTVIFRKGGSATADTPVTFQGSADATGSAGLVGAVENPAASVTFEAGFALEASRFTGLRAGGICGTCFGSVTIQDSAVRNCTFEKKSDASAGRIGGAVGSTDNAGTGLNIASGALVLEGNSFSAANDCYIGGFQGYLKSSGADWSSVRVISSAFSGSGMAGDKTGGFIGYLQIEADGSCEESFSLGSQAPSLTFENITNGVCGGVIGELSSQRRHTVLIKGAGTAQTGLNLTVDNTSGAIVGGLVGKMSGYVRVDGLSVQNTINRYANAADAAGIVAAGAMLDIGDYTVNEAKNSVLAAQTLQGSVVRLSGNVCDTSDKVINLVNSQDGSLIYLDKGGAYTGKAAENNDIGNYGQVFRNDNVQVLQFDTTTHELSFSSPLDASVGITLSGTEDFAKLALTFHTSGAVSGVSGIDDTNYTGLLGKNITLTSDISLENTGIEQLTPSNTTNNPYSGTFDGGGKTITLAVGQNILGDFPGVKAGTNNKRSSLGLFASLNNATVKNLTVKGKVVTVPLCVPDTVQYVASLAGKATGTLTLSNCSTETEITLNDAAARKEALYVGGTVGCADTVSSLSVTGCRVAAKITDHYTNNANTNRYWGGFCGYINYSGTADIDFSSNTIAAVIQKDGTHSILNAGGFIGVLNCQKYVAVNMRGTTANGVSITATGVNGSVGGMLGYSFTKCRVLLDSPFAGQVKAGKADIGGLLYKLDGRMTLEDGFTLSGTTLSATGSNRGLLLSDGKKALVTVKSTPSGFANVTADGFDLFVGENITQYTSVGVAASGGLVTAETGGDLGKLPGNSDWYALMAARPNTKTRYYFNIAGLEAKTDASQTDMNAEDLLYWHVYDYARDSLLSDTASEFFKTKDIDNIMSVKADIDMTDYCFYPTKKEAVTVNFSNKKLTFGKNAPVSAAKQFFGLQAGLISDITADTANATAEISNVILAGKVTCLGGDLGSGALICGTVHGVQNGTDRFDVGLSIKNIRLSGIAVESDADYRPLLCNRLGSYVAASVSGITQQDYTGITGAASSLMGRGGYLEGSTPSAYVKVTLSNIVLDGKKGQTVFTKATLFYDVLYAGGSGSFIYNFNLSEDWLNGVHINLVTYGAELTLNEDQQRYFDKDYFVRPDSVPASDSKLYRFETEYIPYVYIGYDAGTNKVNLSLSVNRKGADFIEGFGTYRHPYIINSAKQLENLCKLLSGNDVPFSDGWQINFPQGEWGSLDTLNLTDYYVVQAKDGQLVSTADAGKTLRREMLLAYLSGAYYKLSSGTELSLSVEYSGLGSTAYPFHGVIHGNGGTVLMPDSDAERPVAAVGYGFINVANGCAVYDLTIQYKQITFTTDAFVSSNAATSGPNSTSLTTSLPHFGGAIAWVVGGDNLLEKVTVTATAVAPGASHTVCGGYVGLISGGGVLLKDIAASDGKFNSAANLYHNNYVGRVLNGYALAIDGKTYDNCKILSGFDDIKRGDFTIPTVAQKSEITGHSSGYSGGTFTIADAKDLLFLSFGMNSGAFTGNNGYGYGETSLSRCGEYSNVGQADWTDGIKDGKYRDDGNKTGIFASYFGVSTDLRNTSLTVKLTGSSYDLSAYGNAMRGMSGAYNSSPVYKVVSFGADSQKVITLNMDMLQYAVKNSSNLYDDEPDNIQAYGLLGRTSGAVTFRNITLSGKVSLQRIKPDNTLIPTDRYVGTGTSTTDYRAVGGLLGKSSAAVTVENMALNRLTVVSPDIAGGLVGYHGGGNLTVNNASGLEIRNAIIKGKRHTGGAVGYVAAGNVNITGFRIFDSTVETRVARPSAKATKEITGTGGIVGAMDGGNTLTITDCTVNKTAVVFYANFNSSSSTAGSGGLVGYITRPLTAKDCTVDGCVVFALSSLSANDSNFPYQFSTAENNNAIATMNKLPAKLRDNLIYNGENQEAAKVLASLLNGQSNQGRYSIGSAGGLAGATTNSFVLTGCTVKSAAAPAVVASHNNTAGLVGEQRSNNGFSVTNCSVIADGYDMYLLGDARAAGIIAYRAGGSVTCTVNNFKIAGTAENPVRIIGYMYSTTDAAGLFGDLGAITSLSVDGCEVSYCIIGATRAGGILSYASLAANKIEFRNVHVQNNLIYNDIKNAVYRAGGLICDTNEKVNIKIYVDGAYIGKNYILGSGGGGLAGRLLASGSLTAKYVISDDNVIRRITQKENSNYTFAIGNLAGSSPTAVEPLMLDKSDLTNVGLIASVNAGSISVVPVSCSVSSETNVLKNYSVSGSGIGTVVYGAYGAQSIYEKNTAIGSSDKTPQQEAIERMSKSFSVDGTATTFYGDSITIGTPEEIDALSWWPHNAFSLENTKLALLQTKLQGVTVNGELQLLCLSDKTDQTMNGYINMLTGGGFDDAVSRGLVKVVSSRYTVRDDGTLEDMNTAGSIVFSGGKFEVGVYDNLETEPRTLTVLSFTFAGQDNTDVYTMHVAVYYQRSVNLKTFVVPVEGEQYYLPSFRNFAAEPGGSLAANVSFGSPFTLYVEFNYNDMAMKLEQMTNFNKQIELTQPNGQSDVNARIEKGTAFILIDLNSATPAGYTYYTLTLSEDARFIEFKDFKQGDKKFALVELAALEGIGGLLSKNRVCTDMGGEGTDCVYTEQYLLAVFPVQNNTDVSMTYNMKAVLDEEQRQETNIVVNYLKSVYGQVSVWGSPDVVTNPSYKDSTVESKQFSNIPDEEIQMMVDTRIKFPEGYVSMLKSQNRGVYGTHIIRLRDKNNRFVELPLQTVVKVTNENGEPVYQTELTSSASQVLFSVGDLIKGGVSGDEINPKYHITLDFSGVNEKEFIDTFSGRGKEFTLIDSFYLSGKENLLGSGPYNAALTYSVKLEETVKLSVTPKDHRYLGINLAAPDDETNSGNIDFTVNARFDSFSTKVFENMTLSFSVSKKVYNESEGKYEYVELSAGEADLWKIKMGETELKKDETVTLPVLNQEGGGEFCLSVNRDYNNGSPELTNYRLNVKLTAEATDGTAVSVSEYFVFLLCKLDSEPAE
ncbi:MAG: hypothetical protein PUC05_02915 [Firmicutes bacterium]|nr:hypothetical protein [Bacillota bacterium]